MVYTLEPFLNIDFHFASFQKSKNIFDLMERLYSLVTGFAKMTAPSFKNLPERLSIPATLKIVFQ